MEWILWKFEALKVYFSKCLQNLGISIEFDALQTLVATDANVVDDNGDDEARSIERFRFRLSLLTDGRALYLILKEL